EGNDDPGGDRPQGGVTAPARVPCEGGAQEREPGNCEHDAAPLATSEPCCSRPVDQQGEKADPSGRGRLDERERRQAERSDVERPAGKPDDEAGEPARV